MKNYFFSEYQDGKARKIAFIVNAKLAKPEKLLF